MKKFSSIFIFIFLISYGCKKKDTVQNTPFVPNSQHASVTTQHNNNYRTGWNNQEAKLTTSNVNAQQFGKLFTLSVDDQVYSQPLVVGNLTISNVVHNVVYIATVNNSVYAFDADNGSLFWHKNYTASGMRPPVHTDMGDCGGTYQDFTGNIGIVGTPVIDSVAKVIYFVARSTDGNNFVQRLHAVDLLSGADKPGSPVIIGPTYGGNGDGSFNNTLNFNAKTQNQRQALTLVNGMVYITWSSHCDIIPYHGWVVGFNASTLQQQIAYNDTPDGSDGGIWESGAGISADEAGNLYAATGNGTVGVGADPTNLRNRGESAIKLSVAGTSLNVSSYFTPYNYVDLNAADLDFGSLGSLLIPNTNYFFTGCKDGSLYLLDRDNMGGYQTNSNNVHQALNLNNAYANEHCQACYYQGASNEYVYIWAENDVLRAYPFIRATGLFDANNMLSSSISGPTGQSGAILSVSSNGSAAGSGILWAVFAQGCDAEHSDCPGVLHAFNADNITQELWNSNQNPSDAVTTYAKFSAPTIANGHVYQATFSKQVLVYGLK